MDCSDDHMSDGRANLGHDGQNGADSPISIMVSLVVDDDSRDWRERYRRHWGWLWTCGTVCQRKAEILEPAYSSTRG
jgi:hypothetical protein